MASKNGLAVEITAIDKTSAVIDSLSKKLAGITAPGTQVTKSLARLSDASGVTRMSQAVLQLGNSAASTGGRLAEALGGLAPLTAALSVGGVAKMTSDWSKVTQGLSFDATRIGSTVGQLQALEGSARLSGSSAEAAASGLRNLQDVMVDTVGGRRSEALTYFSQLKVAFDDGAGHALRATEVMPKLADALSKMTDRSLRARVGTKLLGGAYEDLAPWLDLGSKRMAENAELAKKYGVNTEESARNALTFGKAQTELEMAFHGLGNAISNNVSPALAGLMTTTANWIGKNREMFALNIAGWGQDYSKAFAGIGGAVDKAVTGTVGWNRTLEFGIPLLVSRAIPAIARLENAMLSLAVVKAPSWLLGFLASPAGMAAATAAYVMKPGTMGTEDLPGMTGRFSDKDPNKLGAPGSNPNDPRGIRNNNPLNLSGKGTLGTDGRFGVYGSMEDGVAASARQLASYGETGSDTIRKIITRWAPPSENDTEAYIKRVAGTLGIDADKKIDMHDPNMSVAMIETMARQETGRQLPMDVVQRGVDQASSGGKVDVHVRLSGAPLGTTAIATSSGQAAAIVRIVRSMEPG